MGIFGFTWADAGAVVGATVGGAVLGPPGAMLGGALATYAGATLGDGKGTGQALEEAAVAGIGGAGGAWATDLGGKLVRDGIVRAAGRTLSGSGARNIDRIASRVLLPWNKYDASPIAALGAGFAAYEASPQSRSSGPVAVRGIDIGNGGCPVEMTNIVMPDRLSAPIEQMYRELPGYLCGVWRDFGVGVRTGPTTPKPPAGVTGVDRSGIDTYPGKVAELDATITEFDSLASELAPLARHSGDISARGRESVAVLIASVDRGAAMTPAPGPAADDYALGQLDTAFATGQNILDDAKRENNHLADRIDALTRRYEKLREQVESMSQRIDKLESRPPVVGTPPQNVTIANISNYIALQAITPRPNVPSRPKAVRPAAERTALPARAAIGSTPTPWASRPTRGMSATTPWAPPSAPPSQPLTTTRTRDDGYCRVRKG
ncbi:hypothetical protein NONO_c72230 [Nocardia nova SH22a]|uniref:Uncharacterized protein n=1 Tax=Nocardia nova SH22a TaxID=1415166 RepID=W5TRI1_9NOCA|nr:hypothetical protein [Nocardia nova]AHH21980.1 hypothetical protein NONO_c72230 [Nocardia nova SH22a]